MRLREDDTPTGKEKGYFFILAGKGVGKMKAFANSWKRKTLNNWDLRFEILVLSGPRS